MCFNEESKNINIFPSRSPSPKLRKIKLEVFSLTSQFFKNITHHSPQKNIRKYKYVKKKKKKNAKYFIKKYHIIYKFVGYLKFSV